MNPVHPILNRPGGPVNIPLDDPGLKSWKKAGYFEFSLIIVFYKGATHGKPCK